MLADLALKIRRRDTPFFERLYRMAKWLRNLEVPMIRPIHKPLYLMRGAAISGWDNFLRIAYHQPLFRSRCEQAGKRLHLIKGIPLVLGHVKLYLGDNVQIFGVTTISGSKLFDEPKLVVGDHTYIGYAVTLTVGKEMKIGNHVYIANNVHISGDDGHPVDPVKRRMGLPPEIDSIKPVTIEDDVWIGAGSTILKGVTIGKGSVIAAGSVVTKSIPPYSIAGGNPARVLKTITLSE